MLGNLRDDCDSIRRIRATTLDFHTQKGYEDTQTGHGENLMEWLLLYLLMSSDVNRNWHVKEMSQEMPSLVVCERTARKLEKLATVRRQFLNVRCEKNPDH